MNNPLVSIVVNNYNNEKYLSSCLDSLIAQTYKNIEIVVVDALSTDKSRELIREYADREKRIKTVFTDSYEKYPANTYNLGFLNCSGNFIAINDPDDLSNSTRIEKQLNYLLKYPNIGVVGSNVIVFNDDIERVDITSVNKNINTASPPARNPTLMFRKSIMAKHGMWRWQNEYAADFEWLYRWYSSGVNFFIIQEPLVRYRYSHGTNLSVRFAISQNIKLAKFRLYFGCKLFKQTSFLWWKNTFLTYCYIVSLIIKKKIKKFYKEDFK